MTWIPETLKPYLNFFHPLLMWVLLALSLYAGYLGWQARRTRSAEGETKKALLQGRFANRHYELGSLILALMVTGAIGGMAVTYINNQKLFVGPHLLAGLGMTGAIALSAALSPWMRQGKDWARYAHISLNSVIVLVFAWQALSGMEILNRIISRLTEAPLP